MTSESWDKDEEPHVRCSSTDRPNENLMEASIPTNKGVIKPVVEWRRHRAEQSRAGGEAKEAGRGKHVIHREFRSKQRFYPSPFSDDVDIIKVLLLPK